jgi:hypothetical protein
MIGSGMTTALPNGAFWGFGTCITLCAVEHTKEAYRGEEEITLIEIKYCSPMQSEARDNCWIEGYR